MKDSLGPVLNHYVGYIHTHTHTHTHTVSSVYSESITYLDLHAFQSTKEQYPLIAVKVLADGMQNSSHRLSLKIP